MPENLAIRNAPGSPIGRGSRFWSEEWGAGSFLWPNRLIAQQTALEHVENLRDGVSGGGSF